MEPPARPTAVEQTLADTQTTSKAIEQIEKIFTEKFPESQVQGLLEKIKAENENSDWKARVILKQQLRGVLTDLENLDTEPSRKVFSFRLKSSGERTNLTQRLNKVAENLERAAHLAKYLNTKRKEEFVGESEKANLEVVGREKEKEEIIDQLIYSSRIGSTPVPVITIVGLAGIGKTKLAQLVCQDGKVKQQVGPPAWLSVSDHYTTFDADTIAKKITEINPASRIAKSNANIFVILDDLRIEIGDEDLQALQHKLNRARLYVTAIMITTRSCLVVRNIAASPVKSYALPGLNEDESMSLFQTVLGRGEADRSFVPNFTDDVRRNIVGQCRGVPLAIVIMAKLLYSRRSGLTELTEHFLHELVYSYHDEGLHNESCFTYFSIFPQDYLIDAERLIHLWMAEGFIESSDPSTRSRSDLIPEEIGRRYLRDFAKRSIFQDIKEDEFGEVRSCRIHPLMHDLARFLADKKSITVNPNGLRVHRKVLRASFDLSLDFSRGIPASLFDKAKELRTILFFANTQSRLPVQLEMSTPALENMFKSFKRLCVLDLCDLGIVAVPSSIGELTDLEFLDLSQNDMETLPSSIAKLSKLRTLKLRRCYSLKELPEELENLAKLKHLDMEGCLCLTRMPRKMSHLNSLQTLSAFVANKKDPKGGLEELSRLTKLRGDLEIMHLERVRDSPGCTGIHGLEYLQRLTLRWDLDQMKGEHHYLQCLSVLDCLKPHNNLGVLILAGYQGPKLSNWVTYSRNLVKLSLYDCHRCTSLTELAGTLPKLKILELLRLDNLEYIAENYAESSPLYPNLEELKISDCPILKSWWPKELAEKIMEYRRVFFAKLVKLHVHRCPVLTFIPVTPDLFEDLVLVGCSSTLLLNTINHARDCSRFKSIVFSSVTKHYRPNNFISTPEVFRYPRQRLQLREPRPNSSFFHFLKSAAVNLCTKILKRVTNFGGDHGILQSPPGHDDNHLENLEDSFQQLSSLQCLTIENCAEEINLDGSSNEWKGLKNLRYLTIREIPILRSLSFGDSVTCLRELSLHSCQGLTSISDGIGKVTSLHRVMISKCNKLESLPKAMENLKSLKTLIILECALLLPRCQPATGDDWPQISHIKHIQVK